MEKLTYTGTLLTLWTSGETIEDRTMFNMTSLRKQCRDWEIDNTLNISAEHTLSDTNVFRCYKNISMFSSPAHNVNVCMDVQWQIELLHYCKKKYKREIFL